MFGKNYGEDIKGLKAVIEMMQKQQNEILDMILKIEKRPDNMFELIKIARIQATHKKCISFLMKNITIDSSGKDEVLLLLKEISEMNKGVQ